MKNPWVHYLQQRSGDTFHDLDRKNIKAFNSAMAGRKNFLLADYLEPFPYLGNPKAPVLVLLANPGKSGKEARKSYKMPPDKLRLSNGNLLHKGDDFPKRLHSPDMPSLESKWFKARTKRLVEDTSVEVVSNNLFFVNFHAYHSKSWYPIPFTFETQRYSFWLVTKALDRGAIVLMSRNTIGWLTAVPALVSYKNRFEFQSSRSVHISSNNLTSKTYRKIVARLD